MKYSDEIDLIVQNSLNELIKLKETNEVPFKKNVIEYYYNMYKKLTKEENK